MKQFISDIFEEKFIEPTGIISFDDYEMNKDKYSSFKIIKRDEHIYIIDDSDLDGVITTDLILSMQKVHDGFFIYFGENEREDTITLIIANTKYPFLIDTTLYYTFSKNDLDEKKKKELMYRIYTLNYFATEHYDHHTHYLLYTNNDELAQELFGELNIDKISKKQKLKFLFNLNYQYNILKETILVFAIIAFIILSYFVKVYLIEDYNKAKIAEYQQETTLVQKKIDNNKKEQNEIQKEIDKYVAIKAKKVYHEN